jgi:putative nucleotidyltransferase with HDIG domain
MAEQQRPTARFLVAMWVAFALVLAATILRAPASNWDFALLGILLAFSVFSELTAVDTDSSLVIGGSFLAIVVAMVFLGGPPAALIGVLTILVGWLRWRSAWYTLLSNLINYMAFPLIGGFAFHEAVAALGLSSSELSFYLCVFGLFLFALAINFTMTVCYVCYLEQATFASKVKTALLPLLPSELMAALMAIAVSYLYVQVGLASVALFGVVIVTFQYLLGALLVSQHRADELERRSKQLASFQVGMLSAMLRTLDLRDQMTARHSAAVARYSRAIAQRAGFSRQEEELVHIAALLHDIGKFILPDRILKANVPLTDEDWMLIRRHPQQGARVVSSLDGYGPVAEIILAHHERIDGKGYPRGLAGDDIPELARIISVADTYDVMTARDSYRTPVSTYEAMQELRRVAGKQLDPRFVEVFIELLEGKDVSFQHGEAADFEKELALEARIEETANPVGNANRFGVASVGVG